MDTGSILWADVILLVILALFALGGLQRGFVHETLDVVGLALATALALLFYQQAGVAIDRAIGLPPNFVDLVAFSAVFFVGLTVFAIVSSVVAWPIERTLSRLGLDRLNALLGIAPGLREGADHRRLRPPSARARPDRRRARRRRDQLAGRQADRGRRGGLAPLRRGGLRSDRAQGDGLPTAGDRSPTGAPARTGGDQPTAQHPTRPHDLAGSQTPRR